MRDVTPGHSTILAEIFSYLKSFAQHPLNEIKHLPEWNWRRVLTMQLILSVISGVFPAIVTTEFSTWRLAQGIFFFPFLATFTGLLLTSFLYYYFQVFEKRTVSFIKLATLVFLAYTVLYLFHTLAGLLALFDLLGMAFTGFLLVIGLTENFQLKKQRSLRLVGILFTLVFLVWAFDKLRDARLVRSVDSGTLDQSL